MKIVIFSAVMLLAACAGEPRAPSHAPAESADASSQSAADKRFAEETRGYKVTERDGKKYYCRSERASGSNITATSCITERELRARVEDAEAYRRKSRPSVCAPNDARCGGS
jgi:hypothetical protein